MEYCIPLVKNYKFCVHAILNNDTNNQIVIPIPVLLSKLVKNAGLGQDTVNFINTYKTALFRGDIGECTVEILWATRIPFRGSYPTSQTKYELSGPFFTEVAKIIRTDKFASLWVTVNFEECDQWLKDVKSANRLGASAELAPEHSIFRADQPVVFDLNKSKQYTLSESTSYQGRVSITLKIGGVSSNFRKFEGISDVSFLKYHAMQTTQLLKNQHKADMSLVSSSGKEVKCHKLILTSSSGVFRAMFAEKRFQESSKSQVLIEDHSDLEIGGFLAFMYGDCEKFMMSIEKFEDSFGILLMAEKYDVKPLKDILSKHLMGKPRGWFSDAGLLRVFAFSTVDLDFEPLKKYIANQIKSGFQEMQGMEFFLAWFAENPAAAVELCSYAIKT